MRQIHLYLNFILDVARDCVDVAERKYSKCLLLEMSEYLDANHYISDPLHKKLSPMFVREPDSPYETY